MLRLGRRAIRTSRRYLTSRLAWRRAHELGAPGEDFVRFGRRLGWRLFARGAARLGVEYVLTPVISVRHFELPFAASNLPPDPHRCLDVSSPRLFSLYVNAQCPAARVDVWNPDVDDLSDTRTIVAALGLEGIALRPDPVARLAESPVRYDCIWSISVIEHIAGDYDDRDAVRWMYEALEEGGRLILTFPVDRRFHLEYFSADPYGTQPTPEQDGRVFFQRWYDWPAIQDRLLGPLRAEARSVRWFGEVAPGRYAAYQERLARRGYDARMGDSRMIAEDFREFASWEEMPGMGVCGLVIERTT